MSTQLAIRIPDDLLEELDWVVHRLKYESRTEAMRAALVKLIDHERRRQVGEEIAEGYRRIPQTDLVTLLDAPMRRVVRGDVIVHGREWGSVGSEVPPIEPAWVLKPNSQFQNRAHAARSRRDREQRAALRSGDRYP